MTELNLITHYDLDGVCAAIMMKQVFHFDKEYQGAYYRVDGFLEKIASGSRVIVTDVAMTPEQMFLLQTITKNFMVLDHHPSTAELKITYPDATIIYDTKKSGTLLSRDFLKPGHKFTPELNMLAKAADSYDLWKIDTDPDWFKFGYDLNILFWEYHFQGFRDRFITGFDGFNTFEKNIIKETKSQTQKLIDESEFIKLDNILVCVPKHNSIVNDISLNVPGADYYFIVMKTKNGVAVSLRSPLDMTNFYPELRQMNNVQNVGGHANAGSITLKNQSTDDDVLNVIKSAADIFQNKMVDIPF